MAQDTRPAADGAKAGAVSGANPQGAGRAAAEPAGGRQRKSVPAWATPSILRVGSGPDLGAVRDLWREYGRRYAYELGDQDLDAEAQRLPEPYLPPQGVILAARRGGNVLGIAAIKRFRDTDVCEMKRMYVLDAARGQGVGRRLGEACMDEARAMGFTRMVLDTSVPMEAARALYASLGFEVIDAYYDDSPCREVVFMGRDL